MFHTEIILFPVLKGFKDKVHTGTCGVCGFPLDDIPPYRAEVVYIPCCSRIVHSR